MNGQRFAALLLIVALLGTGCATAYGARTVALNRFDYGEALSRSWNEQMLLNLVRLRYRDTPNFLQVSSVVTQFSYSGRASADAGFALHDDGDRLGVGAGVDYAERPTISYEPLQGGDFTQRFLTPLSAETLLLLAGSGWSIERLMLCCVHRVNDVENAPSAAGPTPDYVPPRWERFRRVATLFRELQAAGKLRTEQRRVGEQHRITLRIEQGDADLNAKRVELLRLLDVRSGNGEFLLTGPSLERGPDEIALIGRPLMGTLFFLSQAVEPPPAHEAAGWVTVTRRPDGSRFDWFELTGSLLRIRSQPETPEGAFVKVRYRGHWFFIADDDLVSKTSFGLLTYLFSLQAQPGGRSPLLTLSAGE